MARSARRRAVGRVDVSLGVGISEYARHTARGGKAAARATDCQLGFIYVLDVNGDGRNDVVTAAEHDYGVFWFEQLADGQWARRTIDAAWSQGHA